MIYNDIYANKSIWILGDYSVLFSAVISKKSPLYLHRDQNRKDSIMETTANTYDDIITRSYKEYYQVILTYITYRITHRYEAEDLTKMYSSV